MAVAGMNGMPNVDVDLGVTQTIIVLGQVADSSFYSFIETNVKLW